jgi:hypothetical protein
VRKQVEAASEWTRTRRAGLGWSPQELARRADMIAAAMGWEGLMPSPDDIVALEAALPKTLPRWFKLLRYAIERAAVPDGEALAWLAERNTYWQTNAPLRMSRPLLFDEEDRLLRKLQKLDIEEQRALRAFISDYADRRCYETKENMARRLLQRLGIAVPVQGVAEERSNPCPG